MKMKYEIVPISSKSCRQVTDIVNHEMVKQVVDLCDDKLCHLSFDYNGGTMVGTSSWYDAMGFLRKDDSNSSLYEVSCSRCWKSYSIRQYPEYDKE